MPREPLFKERDHVGNSRLVSRRRLVLSGGLVVVLAVAATIIGPGLLGGSIAPPEAESASGDETRGDLRSQIEGSSTPDDIAPTLGNDRSPRITWLEPLAVVGEAVQDVLGTSAARTDAVAASDDPEGPTGRSGRGERDVTGRASGDVQSDKPKASPSPTDEPSPSPSPKESPTPKPSPSPEETPTPSP
ncbi:MAG: hypothetical protein ACRDLB_06855 [Actinomycetota bacterium]